LLVWFGYFFLLLPESGIARGVVLDPAVNFDGHLLDVLAQLLDVGAESAQIHVQRIRPLNEG